MGVLDEVQLHLVETWDDAQEFVAWMREPRDVLGIDTETTGLSPERDEIRLIQFGDDHQGWAIDFKRWSQLSLEMMDAFKGTRVLHNSKFDIRQLAVDRGISVVQWPWERTHDVMGMAHILDPTRPKGLKPLAALHIDRAAVQAQQQLDIGMAKNGWDWATVPIDFPPYWIYSAMDPVLTVRMFRIFNEQITGKMRESYDMEIGAIRVAAKMEEYGFRIDPAYCAQQSVAMRDFSMRAQEYIGAAFGEVNINSGPQLLKWFTEHGVEIPLELYTKHGNRVMDADVVKSIDHDLARLTTQIKRADKLAGTYFDNLIKFADENDRVHANINTMGAKTGRMSITEPALQTLPKDDKTVRAAFIPSDGHYLLSIDADQIEARLTAHFSGDEGLIDAFGQEADFFCVLASLLFGYEVKKGMKERDLIKGVVYGKIYGASVETMAKSAGVPISQMAAVEQAFNTRFAKVKGMQSNIIGVAKQRAKNEGQGYVVTPYGRRIPAARGKEYALVNYLLQGHAAEILKTKIVLLDAVMPAEVKLLLPVHDEIIFEMPVEHAVEAQRLAEATLNESEGYAVPITWSGDLMPERWLKE